MKVKRIGMILLLVIIFLIPRSVQAAGACTAVIDKNDYCEETGTYRDPDLGTIKNNNCNAYKKDIVPGYCYSICREEATTRFPNKVPWISVDQYDSILGGNHFIWEEIVTERKRECETTINWEKWKREWEEKTGGEAGINFLVMHIFREDHQKNSDVSICELLQNLDFKGDNADKNSDFYKTFDSMGEDAIGYIMNDTKIYNKQKLLEHFGCIPKTVIKSVEANTTVAGYRKPDVPFGIDSKTPEEEREAKCNALLSATQKKRYIFKETKDEVVDHGRATQRTCYFYTCPNGTPGNKKPNKDGTCTWKTEEQKSKTGCPARQDHIWSRVKYEKLAVGAYEAEWQTYCWQSEDGVPYNSIDFDNMWYDYIPDDDAIGGVNGYKWSLNELKKNIKYLENTLEKCNLDGKADRVSDTSAITVHHQDMPSRAYARNVPLTKTLIEKKEAEPVNTKAHNRTIYKSTCQNVSALDINKAISIKDIPRILGTTHCQLQEYTVLEEYANTSIYSTVSEKYKHTMPEKTNRYIQKTDGKAVDQVLGDIAINNRYIDIGYPNYPVYYKTPTGTYPISLTYQNIGTDGHFVKEATYSCEYKVINRLIPCTGDDCDDPDCVGEHCDRCYGSHCENDEGNTGFDGLNIIYRPISLTNPFPGEAGLGREPGINWTTSDIDHYIKKNRHVKENDVYKKTPMYSFTLTPSAIRKIKSYNKTTEYSDFNLTCSSQNNGKRCTSNFLKEIAHYGVIVNHDQSTCYNVGRGDAFYSCADKPIQDNVKCLWNQETKKMDCMNCSLNQGNDNHKICLLAKGKNI